MIILVPILLILVAGFAYQKWREQQDKQHFPPPGSMVDAGGFSLHLNIQGENRANPTVILDAGMVSFSSNWAWIQPELAKVTRVVAYDRAGLGWSDSGPKPRDAAQSARELHQALQGAGISAPYVLAGHSYGGMIAQAFAALYRDEVAGIVFVDSSHPEQWKRIGVSSKVPGNGNKVFSVLAQFGLLRFWNNEYKLLANGLPQRQYDELLAISTLPRSLATAGDALLVWDELSRPFLNDKRDLGSLPVIALSVTEQSRAAEALTALQSELAQFSSNTKHITVQGAYHEGLVSRQEHAKFVTDAILEVMNAAQTKTPLQPV